MIRGALIAVVLTALALIVGVVVGGVACGSAACAAPLGFAQALGIDGEPFRISGTAMEYGVLLLGFGLIITMLPREPAVPLAGLFMLLLAADGFLMTLKPASEEAQQVVEAPLPPPAETLPADRAPPTERQQSAPAVTRSEPRPSLREGAPPSCPEDTYLEDGACVPCTVEMTSTVPPKLSFSPVNTEAHWVYASDDRVSWRGSNVPVTYLVEQLDEQGMLCDAPAVLVFGSASSDGDRARNKRRAAMRADRLAAAVAGVCGDRVKTFALSLGQSRSETDLPEDRPISIVQVFPNGDADPTGALILEELGYELAEGEAAVPLLSRRDRFPEPWVDQQGGQAALTLERRPQVTEVVEALGAPAACGRSAAEEANLFETSLPVWDDPSEDFANDVALQDIPEAGPTESRSTDPLPSQGALRVGPGRKGVDDTLFLGDTPRSRR